MSDVTPEELAAAVENAKGQVVFRTSGERLLLSRALLHLHRELARRYGETSFCGGCEDIARLLDAARAENAELRRVVTVSKSLFVEYAPKMCPETNAPGEMHEAAAMCDMVLNGEPLPNPAQWLTDHEARTRVALATENAALRRVLGGCWQLLCDTECDVCGVCPPGIGTVVEDDEHSDECYGDIHCVFSDVCRMLAGEVQDAG